MHRPPEKHQSGLTWPQMPACCAGLQQLFDLIARAAVKQVPQKGKVGRQAQAVFLYPDGQGSGSRGDLGSLQRGPLIGPDLACPVRQLHIEQELMGLMAGMSMFLSCKEGASNGIYR
ncbi:hypothetical protein IR012_06715 [Pseudomonas putida]|uniref:hypothetical protein n=1 Tax=Pseudomonas putida TaxID=303 RepID=UPI0018A98108|nr:hypothetical protein [Pseudomonas putida]MBF8669115.1 hypothetical protein [Pseudomonas putida]MBF8712005.1 hypothetical protein [Pseudomonas putida]